MPTVIPAHFQPWLVAVSFLISVAGSYIALHAARLIPRSRALGRNPLGCALIAAAAFGGIGVWSMHFVGMLALKIDLGIAYSVWETAASFAVATGAAFAALLFVGRAPERLSRLIGAGTLLGLGVVAMHYTGMLGMRFGGLIDWSWSTVGLSMVVAIAAANVALWLAFRANGWMAQVLGALAMGTAVCAMHYIGMSAASFVCTTPDPLAVPQGWSLFSSQDLPVWVTLAVLSVCCVLVFQILKVTAPAEEDVRLSVRRMADSRGMPLGNSFQAWQENTDSYAAAVLAAASGSRRAREHLHSAYSKLQGITQGAEFERRTRRRKLLAR